MRWMVVTGLVLALAGCAAGDSGVDASGAGAADEGPVRNSDDGLSAEPGIAPEGVYDAESAAGAPFGEGLNLSDSGRSVITDGDVTLSTEDPVAAADEVTTMVERLGGWVEGMSLRAGTDTVEPSAHVVARLPSGDVGTALGDLREVGDLESVQIDRTDVTMEVHDLAARIRAVEMSVDRMEALLARADSTDDLVMAEQMLTDRQSQLEQLLSQQATLEDQVSMSTLNIDIVVPEEVPEVEEPEEPREGFLGGLENGWNAFLEFGSGALLVIGALIPWLVFVAVLAAVVLAFRALWLRVRPERPARAPRGAPAPAAGPGPAWAGAAPGWPQPGAPVPPPTAPVAPVPATPPTAPADPPAAAEDRVSAPEPDEPTKDEPTEHEPSEDEPTGHEPVS